MSTNTPAAPPASMGADGLESAATGVESGAAAAADPATEGAGVAGTAGADAVGLRAGSFFAASSAASFSASFSVAFEGDGDAAAPDPPACFPAAAANTTSEHE